jgi:hypothetical protein
MMSAASLMAASSSVLANSAKDFSLEATSILLSSLFHGREEPPENNSQAVVPNDQTSDLKLSFVSATVSGEHHRVA